MPEYYLVLETKQSWACPVLGQETTWDPGQTQQTLTTIRSPNQINFEKGRKVRTQNYGYVKSKATK